MLGPEKPQSPDEEGLSFGRVAVGISFLVLGLIGTFVAKTCGRTIGREVTQIALSPKHATGWTESERAKVSATIADVMTRHPESLFAELSDADRKWWTGCVMPKFFATYPGGPAELHRLGQAQANSAMEKAGRECGQELRARIESADEWPPSFEGFFVFTCVGEQGDRMREWCRCVAAYAPKRFAKPGDFLRANQKLPEQMSKPDRKRVDKLARDCVEHYPGR